MPRKPNSIQLKFEPRDLWLGVYWTYDNIVGDQGNTTSARIYGDYTRWLIVYICIIPCFPLILTWDLWK